MKNRILIVDDHQLFIEGLVEILYKCDFVEEVCFETDSENIFKNIIDNRPNIVLLDINLHGNDGLEIGRSIKQKYPNIKIMVISMHNHPVLINKARDSGFEAYLLKDISTDALKQAILSVINGKLWVCNITSPELEENKFLKNSFNLTNRELQIIKYLARGMDNEEISKELSLSYHTIKTHRKNIYLKLELSNLTQLTLFAKKYGL